MRFCFWCDTQRHIKINCLVRLVYCPPTFTQRHFLFSLERGSADSLVQQPMNCFNRSKRYAFGFHSLPASFLRGANTPCHTLLPFEEPSHPLTNKFTTQFSLSGRVSNPRPASDSCFFLQRVIPGLYHLFMEWLGYLEGGSVWQGVLDLGEN